MKNFTHLAFSRNGSFRRKYVEIIGILILSCAKDSYCMDQNLPWNTEVVTRRQDPEQLLSPFSIVDERTTQPTFIQNCGNHNYKRSNLNENRNTCNPVNNNIINFTLIGAGLSKLVNPEIYRGLAGSIAKLGINAFNVMMSNKKTTAGVLVGSLYAALNARLFFLHAKLNNSSCWSQWRSNLAIEELYLIPRQTLYNDLLTNIQTKYTNFRNFRDSLAPLSNFLEDAEQEEAYLKQYESLIKFLKSVYISSFVFYSNDLYKQLNKRSSRLLFIKSAFLNWYAERKLSSPEKETLYRRFPRTKDILTTGSKDYSIHSASIPPLLPEESTDLILENIIII